MAHAIVEWTVNLEPDLDLRGLLQLIARAMRESGGVFPVGGIRVRANRIEDYVIADDTGEDAFINITVKMGAGRPDTFRQSFFPPLFEQIKAYLEPIFERRYLALSLYVEEADEDGSFKHNNIHRRFRAS